MDTAKKFRPQKIFLWCKIAQEPEALRIMNLFPDADVEIIEQQRISSHRDLNFHQATEQGKQTLMIGNTQSFIGKFDGLLGQNIRCCPYHKLVPISNGCPYRCSYCYLAFIYRTYAPFIKININYDTMFRQIRKILATSNHRVHFNMGEMLDSLALDHITELTPMLNQFFSNSQNGYLMLLTKSSNVENLLSVNSHHHTVVSWSINSQEIIDLHEEGTATLKERIQAAQACQQHGYRIRYRIDPGIIYPEWREGYAQAIETALTHTCPENITLGMLRLLPGHLRLINKSHQNNRPCFHNTDFQSGASDGKLRYPDNSRIEFYKFLIDTIRSFNKDVSLSLCRESPCVWQELKNLVEPRKCNCITW